MKKAKVSEIFFSFQGEGKYTGKSSVWIRFFGCSLECNGFGQEHPRKPETWNLPYKTVDVSSIKRLEDLPVFNYGCDSSYSWSKEYKHLVDSYTVEELYNEVMSKLPSDASLHDLCFTGGEPMLWQPFMIEFMRFCESKNTIFNRVQIETSGYTKADKFLEYSSSGSSLHEYFWSISPKLSEVSGEEQGVNLGHITDILTNSHDHQLKFVLNGKEAAWIELEQCVNNILANSGRYTRSQLTKILYIMPVGATIESQTGTTNKELALIANQAINRGYNVSGRLHANIYGNTIGT